MSKSGDEKLGKKNAKCEMEEEGVLRIYLCHIHTQQPHEKENQQNRDTRQHDTSKQKRNHSEIVSWVRFNAKQITPRNIIKQPGRRAHVLNNKPNHNNINKITNDKYCYITKI